MSGSARTVGVAAVQMQTRPGEVEANLERFARAVRSLRDETALIVGPELMSIGYDLDVIRERGTELAETLEGPTAALAGELAGETGATVVTGFLERADRELFDAVVVANPNGSLAVYRKSHLYPPERDQLTGGDRLMVVDSPAGRLGVMICFEHAFPEIATALALDGARILVIPSAVPQGYEHVLHLRTRARAQDNQIFAVASNLTEDPFCGGSLIVDPRGGVLASAGTDETVIRAELDLTAVDREREREPGLELRRPELYR